jgi:hypothetical protein
MTLTSRQHRWIYLLSLALIAVGLPFSHALISIGEIIIAINFLLERRWAERISILKKAPSIWLFLGLYIMHVVGLLWTTDMSFALDDLRIKLPLLIFPIVIPLSQRLNRQEFLWIGAIFSAAVILASFASTIEYFHLHNEPGFDHRSMSLFTSHIRYSLMVCLSYLILLNCAWNEEKQMWLRVVYVLLAIWMSVFVFILQSMTGIVVWILCSYMLLFYTLFYIKNSMLRSTGITILWLTPLLLCVYLWFQVDAFYPDSEPDFAKLELTSEEGKYYHHDTNNLTLENGHYINLYISPLELQDEWNKHSDIRYVGGKDAKGQYVYTTLIRYMTSLGLRKDRVGFSQLTERDIEAIENGVANVRFLYGNALDNRIYTVIWEFDKLLQEQRVQGHSVTQRFEFWRTGWYIFLENPVIGIGTGDMNLEYNKMYERLETGLSEKYRLRAHNQYLNFLVTFGTLGFLFFLLIIAYPFIGNKHANSFLYIGFCIILYTSMLNEDTLETQVGVTLYAFFNAFFLYSLTGLSRVATKIDS